jgi:hypothetical protein
MFDVLLTVLRFATRLPCEVQIHFLLSIFVVVTSSINMEMDTFLRVHFVDNHGHHCWICDRGSMQLVDSCLQLQGDYTAYCGFAREKFQCTVFPSVHLSFALHRLACHSVSKSLKVYLGKA